MIGRTRPALLGAIALLLALVHAGLAAAAVPASWQKGASLTSWARDEYGSPAADVSLDALRATRSDSVAIVPTWYMPDPTSPVIAPHPTQTPSDAGVLHALLAAKARGFRVVMKPHVDVVDGTWRGYIQPADVAAWFASYRIFMEHYADMAQQAHADILVVGTEYESMTQYSLAWRELITDLRTHFSGKLTYGANRLEEAERIDFWDALDYVGVDAYMPLSQNNPNPSVAALVKAWTNLGYVDRLHALADRWHRSILFTEIGYYPHDGTAIEPYKVRWDWPVDVVPQARAYEAFYEVFNSKPWVAGVYWWDWPADPPANWTTDYTPRGTLAQRVIERWNAPVLTALTLGLDQHQDAVVLRGAAYRASRCPALVHLRIDRSVSKGWHLVRAPNAHLKHGRFRWVARLKPGRYRASARLTGRCARITARPHVFARH